ncbi:chromate transporter [Asaccharospora irregularis DSM 2635]
MLPFIQQEFIHNYKFISSQEFLDLIALSQSTPGPIAINTATFVGFKTAGFFGSLASTVGVIVFALVGLTIISKLFDKFKDNSKIEKLLSVLRPITLGFILAAAITSIKEISWDLYAIIAFITSFYLLQTKKLGSISIVFVYGLIGIFLSFV